MRAEYLLAVVGGLLLAATIGTVEGFQITAPAPHDEVDICKQLAPQLSKQYGGKFVTEYHLWDETRVDLLSDDYAVEVDYAEKWAECIGQALYYSHLTDRQAVCLLLSAGEKDSRFIYRCQTVCEAHGIKLWVHELGK